MKNYLFFLVFLLPCFQLNAQGFDVDSFNAEYYLHADGSFDVVEHYDVTFQAPKHGIYRTIALDLVFTDSLDKKWHTWLDINDIEAPYHPFSVNNIFLQKIDKKLEIKIGDKNKTIIGSEHYDIKYTVHNGIMYDIHQDYFYWNLKTDEWFAQFKKITFSIHFPETTPFDSIYYYVYSGPKGNTEISDDFNYNFENGVLTGSLKDGKTSGFNDNLTVLFKFPKEFFPQPNPWETFIKNNFWIVIILASFLIFFILWFFFGRDRKLVSGIQYYPPEGIDSALAGYLINDRIENNDLLSLLPYFGANGYLSIQDIIPKEPLLPTDLLIKKLKPLPEDATAYEKSFFNGLFKVNVTEIKMSDLRYKFYADLSLTRAHLTKAGKAYYDQTSKSLKFKMGCTISLLLLFLSIFSFIWWGVLAGFCMIATFITLLVLNFYMDKKNKKGDEVLADLKGFEIFIHTAEVHRLEMLLKEDPYYFEKTMPYALAFGALDEWAGRFTELKLQMPEWYKSSSNTLFSASTFSNSFNSSMSTFKTTAVSTPASTSSGSSSSSSGGGSSGGGGGGGGGGSW